MPHRPAKNRMPLADRMSAIENRWTESQKALAEALRKEGADCIPIAIMSGGAFMSVGISPEAAERIVKRFVNNLMSEPGDD